MNEKPDMTPADKLREEQQDVVRAIVVKVSVVCMLIFILLGGAVAGVIILNAKKAADLARDKAETQQRLAEEECKELHNRITELEQENEQLREGIGPPKRPIEAPPVNVD